MRSLRSAPILSLLLLVGIGGLAATACAPSRDEDSASAEQMSTADDLALAKDVVGLLGGDRGACKNCHGITASTVRAWGTKMKDVEAQCFEPATLTASERVNCLRSTPTSATSPFAARRLGLYAAGARTDQFKELFQAAFPDTWSSELATFTQKAAMPRGSGAPLSAADFAKLKGWVLRGMPQLDEAFAGGGSTTTCTPRTTPELADHIAAMKATGWGARLAEQSTPMFGCGAATSALECLTSLPDATPTFGAPDVDQKLRRLRKQTLSSHYWVRSSADGRYVGYGMNDSAKVIDLTQPEGDPGISIAADYDPFFLPSNDGFAFAGSHEDGAIRVCRQSLLADASASARPSISLTEPKCSAIGQQVYQSIGTALDGSRYFVTWGSHENDDGGNSITAPLPAAFSANATTVFTPMVSDGVAYRAQAGVSVVLPREGDVMLSPSSLVMAARFGDGRKSRGYRIHFIKPVDTIASDGTLTTTRVDAPVAAEICMPGQKANISFDERFMATHQYVDNSEPDQASLPARSSNIMLVDLLTGTQIRITSSKRGVYALYPHFRADGWLYFVVRDMNASQEYIVASDAALRLAAAHP